MKRYPISLFARAIVALVLLFAGWSKAAAAAPKNDNARQAIALMGLSGEVPGASNVDATTEPNEFAGSDEATIWYSFKATDEGFLVIDFDTKNDNGGEVELSFSASESTFNAAAGSMHSLSEVRTQDVLPVSAGSKVLLNFKSSAHGTGTFNFAYRYCTQGGFAIGEPPNSAGSMGGFSWIYNRAELSTADIVVERFGNTNGPVSVDYRITDETSTPNVDYTLPATGTVFFSSGETKRALSIPLHPGAATVRFRLGLLNPSAGATVVGNDARTSFGLFGYQSEVEVTLEGSAQYPANDMFAAATQLSIAGTTAISPGAATLQVGEPAHGDQSVWYEWTAPDGGKLTLDAGSPGFHLPIVLYTGDSLASLVREAPMVAMGVSGGGYLNPSYRVIAGTVYHIAVLRDDGQGAAQHGAAYSFTLNFTPISTYYFAPALAFAVAPLHKAYAPVVLKVVRNNATAASSVDYTVTTGSTAGDAVFGRDLAPQSGTLTFAQGVSSQTFEIPLLPHAKKLGPLQFNVSLVTTATEIGPTEALVRIFENALQPSVWEQKVAFAGTWLGTLSPAPGSDMKSGFLLLTVAQSGNITGTVRLDGATAPLRGVFPISITPDLDGPTDVPVILAATVPGRPPLKLKAIFHIGSFEPPITGEISDAETSTVLATFSAPRREVRFASPGTYTFASQADANVPAKLSAPAYGTVKVGQTGNPKFTIFLPDGTTVRAAGYLTGTDGGLLDGTSEHLSFAVVLPRKRGFLDGEIVVRDFYASLDVFAAGEGAGSIRWSRLADSSASGFPAFTSTAPTTAVSRVAAQAGKVTVPKLFPSSFSLKLTGANLPAGTLSFQVTIGTGGKVSSTTASPATLSSFGIQADGTFSGVIKMPDQKPLHFAGALFPNLGQGIGNFLFDGTAGSVSVGP